NAASDADPPERSIGIWPVPFMNHFVAQPFSPLPVKYSDLARNDIGRSSTSGRKIESMTERWLLARIAAPNFGTFFAPTIHGRKIALSTGPTSRYLRIQ